MYGFMDESGSPGTIYSGNNEEWLVVSLLMFESKQKADSVHQLFQKIREEQHLRSDFEFHRTHNSPRIRTIVEKSLLLLDFQFITIACPKTILKSTSSYERVAKILVDELATITNQLHITMDSNPVLYKYIRKEIKKHSLKYGLTETSSTKSDGVQAADYVVNISAHGLDDDKPAYYYTKLFKKRRNLLLSF